MPEYLTPGVYIEEVEYGAKPIEGVSTSIAGFLGETERGPTTHRLVTSWSDFQRVYGDYFDENKHLPATIEGFFNNGGQLCYIARIVRSGEDGATTAGLDLGNGLRLEASGEGDWGHRIVVKVSKKDKSDSEFDLRVYYWKHMSEDFELFDPEKDKKNKHQPDLREIFNDVSIKTTSPNFYEKRVNGISNLINLVRVDKDTPVTQPTDLDITRLGDGSDGDINRLLTPDDFIRVDTDLSTEAIEVNEDAQPTEHRKGLTAFKAIDEISILYSPETDKVHGLIEVLVEHCEELKDRFAIIDAEERAGYISAINPGDVHDTKYAAFYYPWLDIIDAKTGVKRRIPPGGHVAGIYARTDVERGVHKAPANEVVRGVVGLQFKLNDREQKILNPKGVNVIRAFPGRGIRVWGARTLSSDSSWTYVNVRRLFIYLEESIQKGTQWAVFEPNDERLWARIYLTITEFLTRVWRDGALMGTKREEAFYVRVDRTTMTQDDIDNGRLIAEIGIAPVKPAEFVIFRIAQVPSGSAINEV